MCKRNCNQLLQIKYELKSSCDTQKNDPLGRKLEQPNQQPTI